MKVNRLPVIASMESPVFRLELHIAHRTPGRSRFHLSVILHNSEYCQAIEGRLLRETGIQSVEARSQTGSLIIDHDRDLILDEQQLRQWIQEALQNPSAYEYDDEQGISPEQLMLDDDEHLHWCSQSAISLMKDLETNKETGLRLEVIEDHRRRFGSNSMDQVKPTSHWEIFRRQFNNSQTLLLAGSAGLSFLTGGIFDVVMIGGVILLNGYVGYISEAHADEVISSIGHIDPQEVRVLRGGVYQNIFDHELVVGDIISVSHGVVPADIRLIDSKGLMVDESPLTGESMPVSKHHAAIDRALLLAISDRKNLLFRGTIVTSGQGQGVVIGTGEKTEIGRVRRLVASTELKDSPLQKDLQDIGQQTIWVSSLICGGVFGIGLLRGQGFLQMLQTSISLAVAAVPEGLPTIGTTTMALGVANLKKQNILVRRLNVLETLGSVEILCLDKTGTLTLNEMIAEEGYIGHEYWHQTSFIDLKKDRKGRLTSPVSLFSRKWSLVAALCTDCEKIPNPDGPGMRWSGSSTEKAIVEIAEMMGMDVAAMQKEMPRFKVSYRTDTRQFMVTYHHLKDQSRSLAAVKGNPEQLLEMCDWVLDQGVQKELTAESRQQLRDHNKALAKKGLRVLGFAFLEEEGLMSIQDKKLVWLGAVGMIDPTREGMVELIEQFHQAGIKTIMMTGDQTETAKAVGKALGFNGLNKVKTADARGLKDLTLDQIADLAEEVHVFSRVSPTDKLRIVQALQKRGRIVAMTGDGINDSPALKAAHVGIAMGFQGTSAARESADIVLKDDNLQVLYRAIEQGRSVRANLRKSIKYLLGTNMSEIALMFLSIAAGRGSPLNSIQLLWINLLTDVLPGLALALDPPDADIMRRPPADPTEPLLSTEAKWELLKEAGILSAGALLSYESGFRRNTAESHNTTAAFVSLTTSQILHTLSASADEHGLIRGRFPRNKRIYGAMGFAGGTIALSVVSPWFRKLLGNAALTPGGMAIALANGVWPVIALELRKLKQNEI